MPKIIKTSKFTRPTTGPFDLKARCCKNCTELIPFGGPCPKPGCQVKVQAAAEQWADGVFKEPEEVKEHPQQLFMYAGFTTPSALTALSIVSKVMNSNMRDITPANMSYMEKTVHAWIMNQLQRMRYFNQIEGYAVHDKFMNIHSSDFLRALPRFERFQPVLTRTIIKGITNRGYGVRVEKSGDRDEYGTLGTVLWDEFATNENCVLYPPTGPLEKIDFEMIKATFAYRMDRTGFRSNRPAAYPDSDDSDDEFHTADTGHQDFVDAMRVKPVTTLEDAKEVGTKAMIAAIQEFKLDETDMRCGDTLRMYFKLGHEHNGKRRYAICEDHIGYTVNTMYLPGKPAEVDDIDFGYISHWLESAMPAFRLSKEPDVTTGRGVLTGPHYGLYGPRDEFEE